MATGAEGIVRSGRQPIEAEESEVTMTNDARFDVACVSDEMARFAKAFNSGDENAMDNAEADFDNLMTCPQNPLHG